LTVLFDLAFVAFKSFAVVSDFDIAHAAITCPQITVVTNHPCYDTVTLNPNNFETELHGIAVVLLCDELTGSRGEALCRDKVRNDIAISSQLVRLNQPLTLLGLQ